MKLMFISEFKIIHDGLINMLKDKYSDIDTYISLEEAVKNININIESIFIYTIFKENSAELDQVIKLNEKYPNIKVLLIDFIGSNQLFFRFTKLKVHGYILGTFVKEDIQYAIHKITLGNRFYDRELLYRLVDGESFNREIESKSITSSVLTKREIEILCQLATGLSNFEIACNLKISENTVKKHISNIFVKINVKDRTQATIYAYDTKLVTKS